jgi:hypothetical protein
MSTREKGGGNGGLWKARKTKIRFPVRFPQPLEIAPRFPHFHRLGHESVYSKSNPKKGTWRQVASLPPSGSFFNEKMLAAGC